MGALVREKVAGEATPEIDAVTVYGPPAVVLAVKTGAVATPDAFVIAMFTPPAKVPLAPLAGAVKVTVTPLMGLLEGSLTVAWNCVANAVLTVAVCGVPPVAVMLAGDAGIDEPHAPIQIDTPRHTPQMQESDAFFMYAVPKFLEFPPSRGTAIPNTNREKSRGENAAVEGNAADGIA